MPKRGRPNKYTDKLADAMCLQIACGKAVSAVCAQEAMPSQDTFYKWVLKNEVFAEKYARAKEAQMEFYAEQILEISDDGSQDTVVVEQDGKTREITDHEHIQRSKLRVDSRKWLMSKLARKKFGEKQGLELSGPDGAPLVPVLNVTRGKS